MPSVPCFQPPNGTAGVCLDRRKRLLSVTTRTFSPSAPLPLPRLQHDDCTTGCTDYNDATSHGQKRGAESTPRRPRNRCSASQVAPKSDRHTPRRAKPQASQSLPTPRVFSRSPSTAQRTSIYHGERLPAALHACCMSSPNGRLTNLNTTCDRSQDTQ